MPEYIEREALIEKISSISVTISGRCSGKTLLYEALKSYRETVLKNIKEAPTADVVEVRHGEWIDNEDDFWVICSNCCIEILDNEMDIIDNYKYCPYCGAKMDGKEVANNG